jgi:hypothetical protein
MTVYRIRTKPIPLNSVCLSVGTGFLMSIKQRYAAGCLVACGCLVFNAPAEEHRYSLQPQPSTVQLLVTSAKTRCVLGRGGGEGPPEEGGSGSIGDLRKRDVVRL